MKILNIAFCDDELIMAETLKDIVERYFIQRDIAVQYHIFTTGQELMESFIPIDLLFLDIDMPKISGIEAGKKFRERNRECKIIMATAETEIRKEVFDVVPIHYATKPFVQEEIESCLQKAIDSLFGGLGNKEITVYKNRNKRTMKEWQICYFKAEFGYLTVKVGGGKESYRLTSYLTKIAEIVDSRLFAMASRQYMLNLSYITEISMDTDTVFLEDERIKISRAYKRSFYERLQEYDLNYRR